MGKNQSKLTPEQLTELQKNTYCAYMVPPRARADGPVDRKELQQW